MPLIVSELKGSFLSYEYKRSFCNGLAKYKGLWSAQYDQRCKLNNDSSCDVLSSVLWTLSVIVIVTFYAVW